MKNKVSMKDARQGGGTISEVREKALFCRSHRKPRLYLAYLHKLDGMLQTQISM